MRRPGSLAAIVLAVVMLGGCGSSGPKRAVDARTEALRFFPAGAALVVLLDTGPEDAASRGELGAAFAALPAWEAIRSTAVARLRDAGISDANLRSLLDNRSATGDIGIPASQLAIGAGSAEAPGPDALAVLVTDRSESMDRILEGSAASGRISHSGSLDEADIYSGAGSAFAVRDGVLLIGSSERQIRDAISLRDGDRDAQLDDGAVRTLLDKLPIGAPLEAYADFAELRLHDPGIAALAFRRPWTRSLGKVALSLREEPVGPVMDVFSELQPGVASGGPLAAGDTTARYTLSATDLGRALGGEVAGSTELNRLSVASAPVSAAATVSGDELRMKLVLSP